MLKKIFITVSCISCLLIFEAQANVYDYKTATWNLQGSSAATESKWNINVRAMVSGSQNSHAQILAVQEAGNVPASAVLMPQMNTPGGVLLSNPRFVQIPVEEYRWNLGTSHRVNNRYIYFSRNYTGAKRVNLAIVTENRADEVIILPPTNTYSGARPIFGVRFGNDYFFSIHASAGGRNAPTIVNAIHNYFDMRNDYAAQWMIMGDFNREPANFSSALRRLYPATAAITTTVHQNHATQISGHNLDYAVLGRLRSTAITLAPIAARFIVGLGNQLSSDHTPVRFYKGG